jgi:hypothetical protein
MVADVFVGQGYQDHGGEIWDEDDFYEGESAAAKRAGEIVCVCVCVCGELSFPAHVGFPAARQRGNAAKKARKQVTLS